MFSLNIEITRLIATNANSYPKAEGMTGLFSSTAIEMATINPSWLRLTPQAPSGMATLEVYCEPETTIILQVSDNLTQWIDWATNTAPSGTNRFTVPINKEARQFFRAWQR